MLDRVIIDHASPTLARLKTGKLFSLGDPLSSIRGFIGCEGRKCRLRGA